MARLMVALRADKDELRIEYDPVHGKVRVEILQPGKSTSLTTDSHVFVALVRQLCTLLGLGGA